MSYMFLFCHLTPPKRMSLSAEILGIFGLDGFRLDKFRIRHPIAKKNGFSSKISVQAALG